MDIKKADYYLRICEKDFHLGRLTFAPIYNEDEAFPMLAQKNMWELTNKLVDIIT